MLYTKPITDITWDDVEAFCAEGIAENAYLDYKEDFPSNLQKTIAAMANTFGGLILIGVEEDDSKPVTPIAGIAYAKGLAERVTNKILGNIIPPVFPETAVCTDESEAKAVVVIRIPESDHTPHAIAQNTKVYLRTGNVTEPHDLATIDRVEWLRDRRERAVELRRQLLGDADERFEKFYGLKINEWLAKQHVNDYPGGGWLTLTACPMFPREMLTEPPALQQTYQEIRVPDAHTRGHFPLPAYIPPTYGHGCHNVEVLSKNVYYVDVNVFGACFYRQSMHPTHIDEPVPMIMFVTLIRMIDRFIASAARLYEKLGSPGNVQLAFHLACEDWLLMRYPGPHTGQPEPYLLDPDVRYRETLLAGALRERSRDFVKAAGKRVGWAYNWKVPDGAVDSYFEEHPTGDD